ncbi:hypothetical protein QPK87_13190 [Kamptonema cortianum]|nr:hypothetical protein [Kamptonema cortianum]
MNPSRESVDDERMKGFVLLYRFHFELFVQIILNFEREGLGVLF